MVFDKCLALIFSLMILGQAWLVRRHVGTWLFPACLFGLFWFALTFIPLAVLVTVPVSPWGTAFILCCLMSFSGSALFFNWKAAFKRNALKEGLKGACESGFVKRIFYALSGTTFLCVVLDSIAQGFSLREIVYDAVVTAASYRDLLSFGNLNVTIYGRVGEILVFGQAALGGLLISSSARWGRLRVLLFAFLPGVFMAVGQSNKWTLFACLAFFYAGLLAYRVVHNDFYLFTGKIIAKVFLCAAVLVPVTTISFMSRGLEHSQDTDLIHERLKLSFISYSCGHLYAFSDWYGAYLAAHWETGYHSQILYTQEAALRSPTYGMYTFAPVVRLLGFRTQDVTDDYYQYGDFIVGNIYTMFRGLVQDFGLAGSLLFMFLAGLLIHAGFFALLSSSRPAFTLTAFIFSVGFFYTSFVRSIFDWSALYLTFALMWCIFSINNRLAEAHARSGSLGVTAISRVPVS